MGQNYLLSPNGKIVNQAGGASPQVVGNTVVHGDVVETFNTPADAAAYYEKYKLQLVGAGLADDLRSAVAFGAVYVSGLSPNPFDIATPGDTVTIKGTGFSAATLGTLKVTDTAGNFWTFTCTFVDANTLTAVKSGDALGWTPGAVTIQYTDSTGVKSNVLKGTAGGAVHYTTTAVLPATTPGPQLNSYTASPVGSDANPANANINGCTVTILGAGLARGQNGFLVDAANANNVIPTHGLSGGALQAAMPGYAAGTVTFNYRYTDGNGDTQTSVSAIKITFS